MLSILFAPWSWHGKSVSARCEKRFRDKKPLENVQANISAMSQYSPAIRRWYHLLHQQSTRMHPDEVAEGDSKKTPVGWWFCWWSLRPKILEPTIKYNCISKMFLQKTFPQVYPLKGVSVHSCLALIKAINALFETNEKKTMKKKIPPGP